MQTLNRTDIEHDLLEHIARDWGAYEQTMHPNVVPRLTASLAGEAPARQVTGPDGSYETWYLLGPDTRYDKPVAIRVKSRVPQHEPLKINDAGWFGFIVPSILGLPYQGLDIPIMGDGFDFSRSLTNAEATTSRGYFNPTLMGWYEVAWTNLGDGSVLMITHACDYELPMFEIVTIGRIRPLAETRTLTILEGVFLPPKA